MRVALTGATGLVGGNLAEALLAAGHQVVATKRGRSKLSHLDDLAIEWVDADLSDATALARAFEGAELVYHCAAAVSIRARPLPWMVDANVDGTKRIIDACRDAGVRRLVHCSSTVCVGVSEGDEPVDEDAPWNLPRFGLDDGYATTKYQSEAVVHDAVDRGLDAVIVNPGFMFGPRDVRPSSGRMILDVAAGRIPGHTHGRNCFVDVRDVAAGMLLAAEKGQTGRRYILGGENLSYREIFGRIAERVGCKAPSRAIPRFISALGGWAGDVHERLTDGEPFVNSTTVAWGYAWGFAFKSDRARSELGYTTRPVEDGIDAAIAWFRAHDML